jgi:hypothetical protein
MLGPAPGGDEIANATPAGIRIADLSQWGNAGVRRSRQCESTGTRLEKWKTMARQNARTREGSACDKLPVARCKLQMRDVGWRRMRRLSAASVFSAARRSSGLSSRLAPKNWHELPCKVPKPRLSWFDTKVTIHFAATSPRPERWVLCSSILTVENHVA